MGRGEGKGLVPPEKISGAATGRRVLLLFYSNSSTKWNLLTASCRLLAWSWYV